MLHCLPLQPALLTLSPLEAAPALQLLLVAAFLDWLSNLQVLLDLFPNLVFWQIYQLQFQQHQQLASSRKEQIRKLILTLIQVLAAQLAYMLLALVMVFSRLVLLSVIQLETVFRVHSLLVPPNLQCLVLVLSHKAQQLYLFRLRWFQRLI